MFLHYFIVNCMAGGDYIIGKNAVIWGQNPIHVSTHNERRSDPRLPNKQKIHTTPRQIGRSY